MGRPWASQCSKCGSDDRAPVYRRDGTLKQTQCRPCRMTRDMTDDARMRRKFALIRHRYGLTMDEYHALFEKQGELCAICTQLLTAETAHVDHDHATGRVRSLLCGPCNTTLGMANDNPQRLRAAADYLEKHNG